MMEPSIFGKKKRKKKEEETRSVALAIANYVKNRESVDRARGTYLTERLFRAKLLIGFR